MTNLPDPNNPLVRRIIDLCGLSTKVIPSAEVIRIESLDRETHRALVEAGYASLAGYVERFGSLDEKMPKRGLTSDSE